MGEDVNEKGGLDELLEYIRLQRGFDFSGYKKPSLGRRIHKRLQARHIDSYEDYRRLLDDDTDEFVELFNTILINVTSFFRDEFAWNFLAEEVIPPLLERRREAPIRIWSAGCATGEEAFSLAILFAEAMDREDFRLRVKIYATDVDEEALSIGRHASFSPKQVKSVPPELVDKYFMRENHAFVLRADVRRAVIFGRHNLLQDPPISRIDLLASRNTLMYFEPETQGQILKSFHFAVRSDGFLFLGKSEALTAKTDLFEAVDLERRVFAKVIRSGVRPQLDAQERPLAVRPSGEAMLRESGLHNVPVPYIAVDYQGRLALANLQARLHFGLTPRDIGRPIQDLEISFRPLELRSRLEQAYSEYHSVTVREVAWRTGDETRYLDVQVSPLVAKNGQLLGCGVTFTDVSRHRRLQVALQEARREAETAYEELQATVEELEKTNEELQATNEELETTNEELQATKEELETMNDELHRRGLDLNAANVSLEAILTSLRAGVVVVDDELRIRAWNAGARELWGVSTNEAVGQHFLNLDIGLPVQELRNPIRSLLADAGDGQVLELEAVNRRGRQIRCAVSLTRLGADGDARGVIMMMQAGERLK